MFLLIQLFFLLVGGCIEKYFLLKFSLFVTIKTIKPQNVAKKLSHRHDKNAFDLKNKHPLVYIITSLPLCQGICVCQHRRSTLALQWVLSSPHQDLISPSQWVETILCWLSSKSTDRSVLALPNRPIQIASLSHRSILPFFITVLQSHQKLRRKICCFLISEFQ